MPTLSNPRSLSIIKFRVLFCCLYKSGYQSVTVTSCDGCIGLVAGSSLYLYSNDGKVIRDYTTIPGQLPMGKSISDIVSEMSEAEKEVADDIIRDRAKCRCCINLFSEVGKA